MAKNRKEKIKIFRVVSLGEELPLADLSELLMQEITMNSQKPDTFFTVTECEIEANNPALN